MNWKEKEGKRKVTDSHGKKRSSREIWWISGITVNERADVPFCHCKMLVKPEIVYFSDHLGAVSED